MSNQIYIDGSCFPNPGFGGWAAVFVENIDDLITWFDKDKKEVVDHISGTLEFAGINQMELTAALEALKFLDEGTSAAIYTDSQNVVRWLLGEQKAKDINVILLVEEIRRVIREKSLQVSWIKVEGHAKNRFNNLVDKYAYEASHLQGQAI